MPSQSERLALLHLARVVESSDDAIVSKDLNGIITSWNRAAERMFGYTAAEAVGRSIRMIIPADRQAEEDMVLARIRAGEAVTHFETVRQRKDGTLIPISLTVSPIHDDAGHVIGASKIARDITERTQAAMRQPPAGRRRRIVGRRDHHQGSGRHHHVVESRPPSGCSATRQEEAIGQSVRMLIPAELQDEEDTVLAKIRAGEKVDHYETVRQRKDGTRLYDLADRVADPERAQGDIVGASKVARDITERSRLMAAAQRTCRRTPRSSARSAPSVASTLDREAIVQKVTDIATELTHAEFGAFFYNVDGSRIGRRLHAVHAVGCSARSVRGFSAIRARPPCLRRRSTARGRCGWTT